MNGKTRSESRSVMTEMVLPNDTNLIGNLLGGRLLHWIDIAGALAATRHAGRVVATVCLDAVDFRVPIHMGDLVELQSFVTWTGNTSIETEVHVYAAAAGQEKRLVDTARLVFVAVDDHGGKYPVPPLVSETPEEEADFAVGAERQRLRKRKYVK